MCLRLVGLVAAFSMLAGPAAAGIFGKSKPKLPTAISHTAARVQRSTSVGLVVKHPPAKYSGAFWGSRFDLARDNYPVRPLMPFLLHSDR